MVFQVLYLVLAFLGLGVLIVLHELAHYFMAKRAGMRVEVFSIGFGRALYSWKRGQEKWQIACLPFGGYVKIAGMEQKAKEELFEVKDGFFSKTPFQRIKVALAGPLANLLFAFLAFSVLWLAGGREQNFQLFTKKIGLVDPDSRLFARGIRSGDELVEYNGRPYSGFKDLLLASVMKKTELNLKGSQVDYYHNLKRTPFDLTLPTYALKAGEKSLSTIGIENPASLIFYDAAKTDLKLNPSLAASGLQDQDRLLWADGEVLFSLPQLIKKINEPACFLTVQRNGRIFQSGFYKVKFEDLKMEKDDLAEIDDWKHEAGIKDKLAKLFFLPCYFDKQGRVENRLSLWDEKLAEIVYRPDFGSLQNGDRILAVDGQKVFSGRDILKALQKRRVLIIVQRGFSKAGLNFQNCDERFDEVFLNSRLEPLVKSIGSKEVLSGLDDLVLLAPIEPVTLETLMERSGQKALL
ncbi:MAG: site-2 protease family protein, partial [Parachlamydiales bacterium]